MGIPVNTPESLGQLVRAVRRAQGIRQDDLAAILGVSHVTLMNIERGKKGVSFDRVMDVLRELGIRMQLDLPAEVASQLAGARNTQAG
jgi:transcriptional regulator with XRE-family HTH domain